MPDSQDIRQLLLDLIEAEVTPEDRTNGSQALIAQVQHRMHAALSVDKQLRALFPPAPSSSQTTRAAEHGFPDVSEPVLPGYTIAEILGRGGVGIVYKATDEALGRDVAIKMVLLGQYATEAELDALSHEARAVAALSHPNIVQVYEVGQLDGLPYIAMEYLPGGTLAGQLAGRPIPADQAAGLVATLARAVHAAHTRGVVHRDLKPANILLAGDGTPKLADFSLARHLPADRPNRSPLDQPLSSSVSAAFGTPSYMAPEQVQGAPEAYAPAVDVYALGVILYESLTGRPPFQGATASDTHQQVLSGIPAPPRELNASVPRDLQSICLKCLSKHPADRYPSALALAEDLQRFTLGEPVISRPVGITERLAKWVKRRPVAAAGLAAVLACAVIIAAMSVTAALQTHRAIAATEGDLSQADAQLRIGDWSAAAAAVERAKARSAALDDAGLAARVNQVQRQLVLIDELDSIRFGQFVLFDERITRRRSAAQADERFLSLLQDAGVLASASPFSENPADVASRISGLPIRAFVLGTLDDWAACQPTSGDTSRLAWIFRVAQAVESQPSDWKAKVRTVETWNSKQILAALIDSVAIEQEPQNEAQLALLLAIGQRLDTLGADPQSLFQRLQQAAPANFFVNFRLGLSLGKTDPKAAVRYFQAAVSIRPQHATARGNLGVALAKGGQTEEAIRQLETAADLDQRSALIQNNLGNALALADRTDDAVKAYRRAMALDPRYTPALSNLARTLLAMGQATEASELFQRAIAVDPKDAAQHTGLGILLHRAGRSDEALEHCRLAVELDPSSVASRVNLAIILSAGGDTAAGTEQLQAAIRLDPRDVASQRSLADALLAHGRPAEAKELYTVILRDQPASAGALHGLGSIAMMAGDHTTAITHFQNALRANPDQLSSVGALGNALFIEGDFASALPLLQRYSDTAGRRTEVNARLIQQCEHLLSLAPRLPEVLQGTQAPADADEAMAFAHLARGAGEPAAAAKLFELAFSRDPRLAADLRAANRYLAARCAARAIPLASDPAEQRSLRKLAREWLADDLAGWESALQSGNPTAPGPARRLFARWKVDPDLAPIRDPVGLASAGVAEQSACLGLWKDIDEALSRIGAPKPR